MSDPRTYEDWVSAFETGTDYEADLVRDRLDDAGVTAVVLTQRDHAFNLNVGDLSAVHVMVPPGEIEEAQKVLDSEPFTDEELDEAAMNADPDAAPAHTGREESMLDSSPNIAGKEGVADEDEPSVYEDETKEGSGDADPRAKRDHRDERRERVRRESQSSDADLSEFSDDTDRS